MPKKPQHEGEAMKSRPFRCTDRQWEDFKLVTPAAVREWVSRQAAKLRKMKPYVVIDGQADGSSAAGSATPRMESSAS